MSQLKSGDMMESSSTKCTPVEVTVPDGDCGESESLDDALEAGGVVPDTYCDVEGGGTPTASDIWLEACSSVRYEERGDIQGVRYSTDDGKEGWTPIEISRKAFQGRRSNSDGSKNNPKISEAAISTGLRKCHIM